MTIMVHKMNVIIITDTILTLHAQFCTIHNRIALELLSIRIKVSISNFLRKGVKPNQIKKFMCICFAFSVPLFSTIDNRLCYSLTATYLLPYSLSLKQPHSKRVHVQLQHETCGWKQIEFVGWHTSMRKKAGLIDQLT